MSRDRVQLEDLERLRSEIRSEVATQFALSMGEVIVTKVLERLADRAGNIQRAQAEAEAKTEEARKLLGVHEARSVELRGQIKELSAERDQMQAALDGLRVEYDSLLPKVQELRAEHEAHVDRVKRIAG
jgi:uncharacterized coiled-coil DUF342 family protein